MATLSIPSLFGFGATRKSPLSIVWRDKADPEVYEEARVGRIFNSRRPERYPVAIVFAKRESDIVEAVNLAIKENCRVSIRSGGHSWPAWSLRDEAILLDLGNHFEMELDETTGVVRVAPATKGRDLVAFLATKGRVVSTGNCPSVGIGGFLLGGGQGWNCNNWGWACEQIVAVDVVTPGGKLLRADSTQHTDLLWAAKGAGPGFPGVVTRFHLQTRPLPKVLRSSGYVYPLAGYRTALNWASELPSGGDDGIEIVAIGRRKPGTDEPQLTVSILGIGDDEEAVKAVLQRVEESHPPGTADFWFCQETCLDKEFDEKGKCYPEFGRYCVENAFLKNDVDLAAVLEPAFTTLPTQNSLFLWNSMIPASRVENSGDMAASLRSDHFVGLYGVSLQESEDASAQSWVASTMEELAKHSIGAYLGEFDFQRRKTQFWGEEEKRRIEQIRREWDPEGRMCGYLGLDM